MNLLKIKIANYCTSSHLGFRQLSSEDEGEDFCVIAKFPESQIALGPQSKSFFAHKPDQSKFVFVLDNAIIEPTSSYIFDSERRLIGDSVSWSIQHAMLRWSTRPRRHIPVQKTGEYLFLGHQAFYHFLMEDFPSYLLARRERPDVTTLVFRTSPRYVFAALRILDARYETIERCTQVERLIFASKGVALQPHTVDVAALENFSDTLSSIEVPRNYDFIYISRLKDGRVPENEEEIQRLFIDRGFKILVLDEFDLESQIAIFKTAKIVAGTHGAGLSNIVWALTGTAVIEISRTEHPICYQHLALIRSQVYFSIVCNSDRWIVNLDEVDKVISSIDVDIP
jgi:hypothetical protein